MLRTRVIPCLLLRNLGLAKTVRFKDPKYVGDPINAIRIFNEKEVDELIVLDILASREGRRPPLKTVAEIASECFMPVCYGGGIRSVDDMAELFSIGIEKVSINSTAVTDPGLVRDAAERFGSQSVVVSIDVKKNFFGKYRVCAMGGQNVTDFDPVTFATRMEEMGAGEILLNSIDRDGTMAGYDTELIRRVSAAVSIPVIACGGAGKVSDFVDAVKKGGASAVAAGSMFVFHGKHRAVLISYPDQEELTRIFE